MSLPVNKKKIKILLLSLSCTLVIFFLNKNSSNSIPRLPFNLRNLFELETADKRCENTEKKFLEQYTDPELSDQDLNDIKKDDRYLDVLKDIIREKDLGKIKKYLPRIIMYIIFVCVDILLIVFWIALCGCCCCGKKNKEAATGCSKCYFFIFCFLNVVAILICICGFILVPCFFKSINGVVCSFYKLVLHFTDGTRNDYSDIYNWKGFEGINNLTDEYNQIKVELKEINDIEKKNTACNNDNDEFCKYYKTTFNELLNEDNSDFIDYLEIPGKNISLMSDSINNIKNNTLDDIEEIMKYFDKEGKLGLYLLFCAIALLCLIGLLTLSFYFVCNCNCIVCLFHLFWNIEMLIIIITILVGVCFGIFGVFSKDLVPILKYVKSEENLNNTDPLLLKFNDDSDKELTNICFNKDGNLTSYVFKTNKKYKSKFNDNFYKDFQKEYEKLKNANTEQQPKLVSAYENLEDILKKLKDINNDLNEHNITKIFECKYFQRDFDILLIELKDSLAKKLSLFALGIIIADLVAFLGIFFGVLIASNYVGKNEVEPESNDKHIKMKVKDNRPNLDSSSDNFRK